MAALFGTDTLINPTFGVVFVLLWVGLVPAALAVRTDLSRLQPVALDPSRHLPAMRVDHREGVFDLPEGAWGCGPPR